MKREVIVKQNDIKDCGACCLASVVKYYGGYVPIEQIRLDTYTDRNGTTAYNMIKALKKYGFEASGVEVDNINNKNILLPAIAHVCLENGLNHFIVIYKITSKNILAMDPAKGIIKIEMHRFCKIWTKFLINLFPKQNILVLEKTAKLKTLFFNIIKKQKSLFFINILFSCLITVLASIISHFYRCALTIIDDASKLINIIILFLSLSFIKAIFGFFRDMNQNKLEKNIESGYF